MRTSIFIHHLSWSVALLVIPVVATAQDKPAARNLVTSYQEFLDLLDHDSIAYRSDKGQRQVRIATKRKDLEGTMLVRWQEKQGLVQLIQIMPIDVPEDRVAAVESAIVRLNHAMAEPGFGFDHSNRVPYYRLFIRLQPRGGLMSQEWRLCFQLAVKQAAEFYAPLQKIAGGANPVVVIEEIRRAALQRTADEQGGRPTT